ncbi:hypothetical protein [Flavobacterium sp.]|uniref:hypothetical protein n=1 Tax=Flavobacterium sp. TaxID=239 RepID=UPI003752F680
MKKHISLFGIFLFLISCNKQEIKFELLNENVICERSPINAKEIGKYFNLGKYSSEENKLKFTNNLKFKITNTTNKKLLFFVKDLKIKDLYCIDIEIFDENNKIVNLSEPFTSPYFDTDEKRIKAFAYLEHNDYEKSENEKLLLKMGFKIGNYSNQYYNQYVIISPKESFIFSSTLALPFVVEDSVLDLQNSLFYKLISSKKYTLNLNYNLKEDVKKLFSKEQLINLKENKIEIFDAKIKTQSIPIVFE